MKSKSYIKQTIVEEWKKIMGNPLIIGHRGYWQIAPENTKLSFQAAYNFGFDGVEMDIHQTKDGELVVIHDETIQRTSTGKGKVMDHTLKELKKLNFTEKFDPSFPSQQILTFEEFLEEFGNKFKVINVEIKTDIIHYKNIEEKILKVHHKVKPKAQIIYSSFNFKTCQILRSLDKDVEIGFLFVDSKDLVGIESEITATCQYLHPWFKSLLNKQDLDVYQKFNLPMNIWSFDKRILGDVWSDHSFEAIAKIKQIKNIYSLISNSKI